MITKSSTVTVPGVSHPARRRGRHRRRPPRPLGSGAAALPAPPVPPTSIVAAAQLRRPRPRTADHGAENAGHRGPRGSRRPTASPSAIASERRRIGVVHRVHRRGGPPQSGWPVTEFAVPTANSGVVRDRLGTGREHVVHRVPGGQRRADHADGRHHRVRGADREQRADRHQRRRRRRPVVHRDAPRARSGGWRPTGRSPSSRRRGVGPFAIAAGPDGALWFTEHVGNRIGRITTGGVLTEFIIPTANADPLGLATGPDGNLWITEHFANKVARLTPTGTLTEYRVPTANAQPERHHCGTGRQSVVHRDQRQPGRAYHPGGGHHRVPRGGDHQPAGHDHRGTGQGAVVLRTRRQPHRLRQPELTSCSAAMLLVASSGETSA